MPTGGILTAALIAGGTQALTGVYQNLKANQQRKKANQQLAANPYTVPSGVTSAVNMAGTQAKGYGMAGQNVMEENIASNTGATVGAAKRAATSPSQVLASTVAAYQAKQQQQQQLDLAAAQDYRTRQQGYQSALMALAPYQEKVWEYNTLYPVSQRLNRAAQLQGAGTQNIGTGISSGLSAYANQQYMQSLQPANVNSIYRAPQPLPSTDPSVINSAMSGLRNMPQMYNPRTPLAGMGF